MIVGILSDTHGHAPRTAAAVGLLKQLGAQALVHCGDVGGPGVLEALVGLPAWFVWGNTDHPDDRTGAYAARLGIQPPRDVPTRLELAGRRLAVFHGHEPAFEELLHSTRRGDAAGFRERLAGVDYVLYGHTHQPADDRFAGVRLINPGALRRAAARTVATLELLTDELRYWLVDESSPAGRPPQAYVLRRG